MKPSWSALTSDLSTGTAPVGGLQGGVQGGLSRATQAWRTAIMPRWQGLAPRERLAVIAAGVLVALALVWWIGVAPALSTLRQTPAAQSALDAQLAQMRLWASEAQELRRQPALPGGQAEAAVRTATSRLGNAARLTVLGDRVTVQFTEVESPALLAWLGEVRSAARARPVQAELARGSTGYTGTVVLGLTSPP